MKRVVVFSLGLLLVISSGVFGAKKSADVKNPEEKLKPADESIISRYITLPETKLLLPFSRDTVGFTYYDYQHNNSQRRQIARCASCCGWCMDFTWMNMIGPGLEYNRYVDYNYWNGSEWMTGGGMHITPAAGKGGFTGLDLLPDGREVIAYHQINNNWFTTLAIEKTTPGLGDFNFYDPPDSVAGSGERLYWPYVATSKDTAGNAPYIHITNFSQEDYAGYVRCYQDPNPSAKDTLWCQSPGWGSAIKVRPGVQLTPNKVLYNFPAGGTIPYQAAPVATSPTGSGHVAIVWYDQTGGIFTQGEIFYVESTVDGSDWLSGTMNPIKITNYGDDEWHFYVPYYTELAAVYDYDDNLHIFWTASRPSGLGEMVTLFHWSQSTGIRQVTDQNSCTADMGDWNYVFAKFTCGVESNPQSPYYNYLYLVYTRFENNDTSAGGFANGDLYLKPSSNGGLTWGPEENLTNTKTPGCLPGDCKSEHWGSVTESIDDTIYVQYIMDLDAGGVPRGEGSFTNNPVRYLKYDDLAIPAVPWMLYYPNTLLDPLRQAPNNGSINDSLTFENIGTATLDVIVTCGASWVNITGGSFSVPEGGTHKLYLTLNGAGKQDTILVDSLRILSNHGGATDTQWVKIHFVVTNNFSRVQLDLVNTGTGGIITTVSNVGNLANGEDNSGMYYNGHNYLFDCSPVLLFNIPGYGWAGANWMDSREDFLPLSALEIFQSVYASDTMMTVISQYAPITPFLPPPYHWFWSWYSIEEKNVFYLKPTSLRRVILKYVTLHKTAPPSWWPNVPSPPSTLPSVYFGLGADFDVPTEATRKNIGGFDAPKGLIWIKADTAGFENYYGAILFLKTIKKIGAVTTTDTIPYGAYVLDNATQMWPFLGYNDDSLYKYMSIPGYLIESDSAQDKNILISATQLTNPDTSLELTVKYALLVTDQGLSDLYSLASQVKQNTSGDVTDSMSVIAYSPVDIFVEDPIGHSFGPNGGDIPGADYDSTTDINADGDLDDRIFIPNPIPGQYTFRVKAEPGADTGHYVLAIKWDGNEDTPLIQSTVPPQGKDTTVDYTAYNHLRGDANGDEKKTVSDVVFLINYLFKGGPAPDPVLLGDVNCDGKTTVSDVVYLINYLFKGGPAPCS
jgi:hypothetical protein